MCGVVTKFPSQATRRLDKRELQVRSRWSDPANARGEFASEWARTARFCLLFAALSFPLAGCVTTASVPNSPFLTAVARVSPFRANSSANDATTPSPPVENANAATSENIAAGTPLPATAVPPSDQPSVGQNASVGVADNAPIGAAAGRAGVYPQIASASPQMVQLVAAAKPSAPLPGKDATPPGARGERKGISLSDAVGAAVLSHPLMGAQAARVTGSLADVRTAQGATKPQLQVYAGSGGSYLGSYSNYPSEFGQVSIPGSTRSDAGFTLRQLVYDFGAAKADISRSNSIVDAERLRLADQAEDIALRTVNAYFNLLEQEKLIALIDKVVADDNGFANLVKLSEQQGNGTLADVNRIKSKVIELEALRTDIKTAYSTAQDEFFRLTKLNSSKVNPPASISSRVPRSFEVAFEAAKHNNPSLLALTANGVSIDQQLASQKAQALPRIDLQGDGLVKHYIGSTAVAATGVVDTRLMLMVSYKLLDGGVMSAQADRILEDRKANDFKAVDEVESIELNLKRFYQALSANRIKETAAVQGTSTAEKANSLYLEQFKAGKRTVFEVLDSRMVVFTMQKNAVNANYEQLRAAYGILRNIGTLVETAIRA
jgi:outer membrane protein, adhesin transport system